MRRKIIQAQSRINKKTSTVRIWQKIPWKVQDLQSNLTQKSNWNSIDLSTLSILVWLRARLVNSPLLSPRTRPHPWSIHSHRPQWMPYLPKCRNKFNWTLANQSTTYPKVAASSSIICNSFSNINRHLRKFPKVTKASWGKMCSWATNRS